MEKSKQYKSIYSISKTEYVLLEMVKQENLTVFAPKELIRLLGWKKQKVHNILQQLKNKGIILSVKRDAYTTAETLDEHIFQVATEAISPSYISFWTALGFYGFTEQQPRVIQLVAPKQFKAITLGAYKIVPTRFRREKFFGYKKVNHFTIAEKEKCIIDALAYPEKAGGFEEVIKCLKNSWKELDKRTLLSYLKKFNNPTLNARVGYILERAGLVAVKLSLPNAYVKLNKEKPLNKSKNKKWRIIVNDEIK